MEGTTIRITLPKQRAINKDKDKSLLLALDTVDEVFSDESLGFTEADIVDEENVKYASLN